jgi:hypothetical protein
MPKVNLLYTGLNLLKQERVTVTHEGLKDNLVSLVGDNVSIFYDGIDSVHVEHYALKPWLIYNKLDATNIAASKELQNMFGFSAENVEVTYAVWDFNTVNINADGDFGEVHGTFDLKTMMLKLLLEPSGAFSKSPLLGQYFKKGEEGYVYESKIQ